MIQIMITRFGSLSCFVFCISLLTTLLCSAQQPIPLRDPRPFEQRPAWWLSCWGGHVVAVKGVLRFDTGNQPDVVVHISPNAEESYFGPADRQLLHRLSYQIATLSVNKLVFASPGIELLNTRIAAMRNGDVRSIRVLVPCLQDGSKGAIFFGLKPAADNEGLFIFRYGDLLPGIPLTFDKLIPDDGLRDAMTVFDYREKYDYHKHADGH